MIPNLRTTGKGGEYFLDTPRRSEPYKFHQWSAQLYLAKLETENNAPVNFNDPQQKKIVTILDGISWGWSNRVAPLETQKVSDSLEAGDRDTFRFTNIKVGSKYLAWIDNNLPENSCNPNTNLFDHF